MNEIFTRTSIDEITYKAIRTPCKIIIQSVKHATLEIGNGFRAHHIYVSCEAIKGSLLPLDANPREPSLTSQVKDMQETLQKSPLDFVKKNNGMALLCEDVSYEGSTGNCIMSFGEKEGVCNGGHTYFAIVTTTFEIDKDAQVHLELLELPEGMVREDKLQEIIKIARARNNNNRLSLRSEADYLGYYNLFKGILQDTRYVSWHEGDSDAYEDAILAEHFIRLITCLDPLSYQHPTYCPKGERHKTPVTAVSSIHNAWYEKMEAYRTSGGQMPLRHMSPLVNDMFMIRDMISRSLKHDSLGLGFRKASFYQEVLGAEERELFLDRKVKGNKLPPTFEVLIMGLFRTNIWLHYSDKLAIDLVGWYVEPGSLWAQRKQEVLEALANDFNEFGKDPKQFIRATAPYRNDLFTLGMGQSPPLPEIIYIVDSKEKLQAEKEKGKATYWFDGYGSLGLQRTEDGFNPSGAHALYRAAQ